MAKKFRKRIHVLLALALIAGNVTIPAYAKEMAVFKDDFNQKGVTLQSLGYTAIEKIKEGGKEGLQGEVALHGVTATDQVLYINDSGDDHFTIEKTFSTSAKVITTSLHFMQEDKITNSITPVKLFDKEGKVVAIIEISDRQFKYRSPNEGDTKVFVDSNIPVEPGKWYDLKLVSDLEKQTSTLYINGVETGIKGVAFNEKVETITKIQAFSAGSSAGPFYLDNIAVYEGSYTQRDLDKDAKEVIAEEVVKETVKENQPVDVKPTSNKNTSLYEAEDAYLEGAIIDNKHLGFTGTGFADYSPNQPGGIIEWDVQVAEAGEYVFDIHYAHGSDDDRPIEIKVNDTVVAAKHHFESTGAFNAYTNSRLVVNLPKGDSKVRFTGVGANGGPNIDSLMIYPSYEVLLEAEDFTVQEGVIVDTQHIGFTGGGFTDYKPNQPGGVLEWEVDIPYETSYSLSFRYANGGSASRPLQVEVNGEVVSPKVEFEGTGAWTTWIDVGVDAVLKKGENTIRAVSVGADGGPNLDSIRISTQDLAATQDIQRFLPDGFKATPVEEIVGKAHLKVLDQKGVISADPTSVKQKAAASGEFIEVESVDTYGGNLILVTLDSYVEDFKFSDLELKAGSANWYSLNGQFENRISVKRAGTTVNPKGQTVVVYEINEGIENNRLEAPKAVNPDLGDLAKVKEKADNFISWQMDNGGWDKGLDLHASRPWDGKEGKNKSSGWVGVDGEPVATIDNDATYTHIQYLASVYQATGEAKYKESVEKGLDFLFRLQYPSGGFAQVYPRRGNYSDYVTFNDEAMISVLSTLQDIENKVYPYNGDLISPAYSAKIQASVDKAVAYILKAQIVSNGKLTAWCAQHDPVTYEPKEARAYEHPSISGQESIAIIKFLMTQEQTPEIKKAVEAAVNWLKESEVKNMRFDQKDPNGVYFIEAPGMSLWYRFYQVDTNLPIFSGRDGVVRHNIAEIEEERRTGYSWSGSWGGKIIEIYEGVGYYPNKIQVEVVLPNSKDANNKTLQAGAKVLVENENLAQDVKKISLTVGKSQQADYQTIGAAIDAVPTGNTIRTEIIIEPGVYKEVVTIPKGKDLISFIGKDASKTILTFDNYSGKANGLGGTYGTNGSASSFINANDFIAKNITFENSFDESSTDAKDKQAVALNVTGERAYFEGCRFIGNQDTLYVRDGSSYFVNSYIEGDVDFIFGEAQAVFENCQIHSLNRGSETNNGYITAASTQKADAYGYLFINCELTAEEGTAPKSVHLGRPWHPSGSLSVQSSVLFKECVLGEHIHEAGWTSMSGFEPENERFFEYNNTGKGAVVNESRQQLTANEAALWTIETVLKGWNPKK